MMPSDRLRTICQEHAGHDFYFIDPVIPTRKVVNARRSLRIPNGDGILGLIDCTVFGSAKHALVIASSGIYSKGIASPRQHLPWARLRGITIRNVSGSEVTFSDGTSITVITQGSLQDWVVPLLDDLLTETMKLAPDQQGQIISADRHTLDSPAPTTPSEPATPTAAVAPSRIDVNIADTTTLMLLPGITAKTADDIQRERRRRLGFTRLEELEEFLHLQPAEVEQLRPLTTFATGST